MAKAKKRSTSTFLVGAGVAAAAAAGIVAFLTQTTQGKKMVKKGREHAADLAHEVAKRAEKAKKLTKKGYEQLVDDVVAEYAAKKKMTAVAAKELSAQLKKEWTRIQKQLKNS